MNDLPDFLSYGYQVEKELGSNRAGGRVTYLAQALATQQLVVIKQFQFARSSSGWSSYDLYNREIDVLRGLEHSGIPRYLASFQTEAGFCMVQEYKPALSLSTPRSFSPDNIRQIAIAALSILVYLQNRIPPVIHRDVKPENILVDEQMNVYLVDFGFARVGDGEVGVSSVVKGTLGFMPPEQLFNRQLTEASDLYGLGLTLICLMTRTQSEDIGNLVDISYRVSFKQLIPKLSIHWLNWLEKMVEPKLSDRFSSAAAALEAMPTTPLRLPEVKFSHSQLKFTAQKLNEALTQQISLTNLVPETQLEGRWEVAPHPSDPPHSPDRHAWITPHPAQFSGNQIGCQISVNTAKLMADKLYQRTLLLHSNSHPQTYALEIEVKTASVPIRSLSFPYKSLAVLFLGFSITAWSLALVVFMLGTLLNSPATLGFGTLNGSGIGFQIGAWMLSSAGAPTGAFAAVLTGAAMGLLALISVLTIGNPMPGAALPIGVGIGILTGAIAGLAIGQSVEQLIEQRLGKVLSVGIACITAAVGFLIGLCFAPGWINLSLLAGTIGTGAVWVILAAYLPLQRKKLVSTYRQQEQYRIGP